jgi:hypothetical protein
VHLGLYGIGGSDVGGCTGLERSGSACDPLEGIGEEVRGIPCGPLMCVGSKGLKDCPGLASGYLGRFDWESIENIFEDVDRWDLQLGMSDPE